MNRLRDRTVRVEAEVAARIAELFERHPALRGFSVQPGPQLARERSAASLANELVLSDLAFYPEQDHEDAVAQRDEISAALAELMDERPEAAALLSGRTFARSLH